MKPPGTPTRQDDVRPKVCCAMNKISLLFISPSPRLISRCEAVWAKHKIKLFRADFNQRKQVQESIASCWSVSNHSHQTVEWRWFAGRRSEMTSRPAYGSFCWLLEFRGSALKQKTGNEEPQNKRLKPTVTQTKLLAVSCIDVNLASQVLSVGYRNDKRGHIRRQAPELDRPVGVL